MKKENAKQELKDLGEEKEKKFTVVHHDMDHLFGKWSQKEFECIQGKIDSGRKIDRELWRFNTASDYFLKIGISKRYRV